MKFIAALSLFAAFVAAAPATEVVERATNGDSGCYPFEDPDCGINYAVCQCANGWFYQFNPNSQGGCQPPWGILSKGVSGLPGWRC
ncbi:hypothetical protein DL546_007048 [Coniochaeta pulveracea]|uniref:Chitin-binding type-2 domain-containing protein n=1 Tax=Coniochaeta pulveracea TaxID=177199 RepID=A0A420Y7R6_9PEZI|nr:hypothetical protein DL546_007048 [Coniochaeta pulveracea]